ncbi:hypothetical protein RCL_jg19069.t1 [Rhizophagus clarus]|uniref:Uncharacterized protein n=1 Tax=Rhizophagus clarus TaxID=94130 RepID=A0A8H3LTW9_9GLOM|nr:hypothetical protein RCL_jg19069.t1 [Rhizophagus clarus]
MTMLSIMLPNSAIYNLLAMRDSLNIAIFSVYTASRWLFFLSIDQPIVATAYGDSSGKTCDILPTSFANHNQFLVEELVDLSFEKKSDTSFDAINNPFLYDQIKDSHILWLSI